MQKLVRETEQRDSRSGSNGPGPSPDPRGMTYRNLALPLVGVVALAVAGYTFETWRTVWRFQVTTDDAYVSARPATLASKIAGYVAEIPVADNAAVKAGDLIARIDPGDFQLAVRAARDATDTQRAAITRIGKQIAAQRAAVEQAEAQVVAAKAGAVKTSQDLKRQSELATRKINSAQALDQAQAANEQAMATAVAAEAAVRAASASVGVLEAQRTEAESTLHQSETALAKAERDLTFTEVRAPFDGVIGNRAMQVGDYVQAAQRLASLVPLQATYIDANFKETQLARIKPGQPVTLTVDAQPGHTIDAVVASIAPASGAVFSLLPPDNATGNFTKIVQRVPVRIALPEAVLKTGVLRPGMSVVVTVNTKPGSERAVAAPAAVPTAAIR
jgi:membrane fusion protein, multidrug efflux system